jgi:hypothetical protein
MKTPLSIILIFCTFLVFNQIGCAHGDCNNLPQRPLPEDSSSTGPTPPLTTAQAPPLPVTKTQILKDQPTAVIFKSTGETQCGMNKGIALEQMQSQLTDKNIDVIEAHTQSDGLIHMALCGAPAGTIHVFTIPKSQLKKALGLGFKILKTKNIR